MGNHSSNSKSRRGSTAEGSNPKQAASSGKGSGNAEGKRASPSAHAKVFTDRELNVSISPNVDEADLQSRNKTLLASDTHIEQNMLETTAPCVLIPSKQEAASDNYSLSGIEDACNTRLTAIPEQSPTTESQSLQESPSHEGYADKESSGANCDVSRVKDSEVDATPTTKQTSKAQTNVKQHVDATCEPISEIQPVPKITQESETQTKIKRQSDVACEPIAEIQPAPKIMQTSESQTIVKKHADAVCEPIPELNPPPEKAAEKKKEPYTSILVEKTKEMEISTFSVHMPQPPSNEPNQPRITNVIPLFSTLKSFQDRKICVDGDPIANALSSKELFPNIFVQPLQSNDPRSLALNLVNHVFNNIETFQYPKPPTYANQIPYGLTIDQMKGLFGALITDYKSNGKALTVVRAPCKVFGDLHGQFSDLLAFFRFYGMPRLHNGDLNHINYIFNGDFVDRGPNSLEVFILLVCLRLVYKEKVTLVRGNHELETTSTVYGLLKECNARLGADSTDIFDLMNEVFKYLPIAAVIESLVPCGEGVFKYQPKAFVIHGGIGPNLTSISQIAQMKVPITENTMGPLVEQALWDDPMDEKRLDEYEPNPARGGSSYLFSEKAVHRFCDTNKIDIIIRSHQCIHEGFEYRAGGRLVTVFSAPNYCGIQKNHAAFLLVSGHQETGNISILPYVIEYTPQTTTTQTPIASSTPFRSSNHMENQGGNYIQNSSSNIAPNPSHPQSLPSYYEDYSTKGYDQQLPIQNQSLHPTQQQQYIDRPASHSNPYNSSQPPATTHSPIYESSQRLGDYNTTSAHSHSISPLTQSPGLIGSADYLQSQKSRRLTPGNFGNIYQLYEANVNNFQIESGVQPHETAYLDNIFKTHSLVPPGNPSVAGLMNCTQFYNVLREVKASELLIQACNVVFASMDWDNDGFINERDFMVGMLALSNNTPHNIQNSTGIIRSLLIFRVYDSNKVHVITPYEFMQLVSDTMTRSNVPIEQSQQILGVCF